ncbi:MAG: recombinase family protein [Terracidiphilus sp.]|jgi:DNA invertase Pin-like site-specific DNA recombinase
MMAAGKFVSYLRVSTQQQGRSGLGLEAQKEAVAGFLNGGHWKLVEEVVEVESGKRSDRPQLARALSLCRVHRATLLVAKLDRLARNVAFISALMEAGVAFQAVDLPNANNLTVHIMAAMAEYEAKAISERTKVALAAAKARGTKLGFHSWTGNVPRWQVKKVASKGNAESSKVRAELSRKRACDLMPVIDAIRNAGATSLRQIATALNEKKIPTARGGEWSAVQVQRLLALS